MRNRTAKGGIGCWRRCGSMDGIGCWRRARPRTCVGGTGIGTWRSRSRPGCSSSARTRLHLGKLADWRGEPEVARGLTESCLAVSREAGSQDDAAEALKDLAGYARDQSDFDTARALLDESLALSRGLGKRTRSIQVY